MALVKSDGIAAILLERLGISPKLVHKATIIFEAGNVALIEIERYITLEESEELATALEQYQWVPKGDLEHKENEQL